MVLQIDRPDWCPQRVWDEAVRLVDDLDPALLDSQTAIESAAKAILAAEQREREACALIAENPKHGVSAWRTRERIATAILNRSQDQ